jgi:cobalt-zinc-cadmium efflux system membrane fusion protein
VRGVVKNPDSLLKAEMYVVVNVLQDVTKIAKAGVDVPATALFMKKDDSFLFVEESPGQYRRQKVKVGVEQDNKVTVYEGLKAGQKVVTEGALLLQAVVEPEG